MKIFKVRILRQYHTAIEPRGKKARHDINNTNIDTYDKMFALAVEKEYWVLDEDLYDYQGKGGTKYTNCGNISSGKVGINRFDVFIRVRQGRK